MPGRAVTGASKTTPVVHVYATTSAEAEAALIAVGFVSPARAVRVHLDSAEGRGATSRPELMALLAEASPGDIVCGTADALAAAPPRARSRLLAVVKARDVGLALIDDPASMGQVASGADRTLSLAAVRRATRLRPPAPAMTAAVAPAPTLLASDVEARVLHLLNDGQSWRKVQSQIGVSRAVIARCAKRLAAIEAAQSHAAFARSRAAAFSRDDALEDRFDSAR